MTGHPHRPGAAPHAPPPLDVGATLRGRTLLVTGATGFLGKVALSLLLDRYPEVGKVFVLVRPGTGGTAEARFFGKVAAGRPFDPLRARLGDRFDAFLREKCVPLAGDVTAPLLGLSEADLSRLAGLDAVVNSAGLVDFNPSLELALAVNVEGVRHAAELCRRLGAALLHVSTCFVAGARDGVVHEDEPILGAFPRRPGVMGRPKQPELDATFSVEAEEADCAARAAEVRASADDRVQASRFHERALERLRAEGRAGDEKALRLATGRERRLWISQRLVELGMERARHWGWPNTYTYTKAMGEQVLAAADLPHAICRPAIVESALRYPFPGWNEGFTTSAPLAFLGLKGHRAFPAAERAILDVVPVDLVAAALVAATAELLERRGAGRRDGRVYHLASGDVNPLRVRRSVELTALYRRRFYREREEGSHAVNQLLARFEPYPVSRRHYETFSAPAWAALARLASKALREETPRWGAPRLSALAGGLADQLDEWERQLSQTAALWELYLPFVWENEYVFRCAAIRALRERLAPADRARLPWDPEALDWRRYWLDVHMKGMEAWVFPGLEEASRKKVHAPRAHRDLVELLEAAAELHPRRTALRLAGQRKETFTYRELRDLARRTARFLAAAGLAPGERVLLAAENRPEWAVAFFGVLLAGGVAVPVDPELGEGELLARWETAGARLALLSERTAARWPGLAAAAAARIHGGRALLLDEPLAGGPEVALARPAPDDPAALLFAPGAGGAPRPVTLAHRHLASLAARLGETFDVGPGDGLLSVLPLHHLLELACGLLVPLSRGAEVEYLDELTADGLGDALESGRVSAMVGVPALWSLLHRRITQEVAARPGVVGEAVDLLRRGNGALRDSSLGLDLGKLLFWPVHRRLGGRLRHLVSGGAALDPAVRRAFRELGFDLHEAGGLAGPSPALGGAGELLASAPEVARPLRDEAAAARAAAADAPAEPTPTPAVPAALAAFGRRLLGAGQKALYEVLYGARVTGRAFVPHDRNVLVVANHASHLDMGLVKVALAEEGERLAALAARDYFFDTPLKRAYFENFTNLIPMERHGSLAKSLRAGLTALGRGYHLLIFPEGTRSRDGAMGPFYPAAGHLALHAKVDVLPVWLGGTHEALPVGSALPRRATLEVRIGEPIRIGDLEALTAGLTRREASRRATQIMEEAVRRLGVESEAPPSPASGETATTPPSPPSGERAGVRGREGVSTTSTPAATAHEDHRS